MLTKKINLQLFAGDDDEGFDYADADIDLSDDFQDEEINIGETTEEDLQNDPEEKSETGEETNELASEEEEISQEQKKPAMDKKTKALIAQKKANKELRDKLAAKEAEIEQQRLQDKKTKLVQQYIDDEGYDEDKAIKLAEKDIKTESLEARLDRIEYTSQAEKLINRFPDVMDELHRLIPLCKQTGWSLEKICRAELTEVSAYDVRTRAEQEAIVAKSKGQSKKIDAPTSAGNTGKTALTEDQERLYQMYIKAPWGKGKSKKDFLETLNAQF